MLPIFKKENSDNKLKQYYDIKHRLLSKYAIDAVELNSDDQLISHTFDIKESWSDYIIGEKQVSYRLLCNGFEFIDGVEKKIVCIDNLCERGAKFKKQKHPNAKTHIFLTKGSLEITKEVSSGYGNYKKFIFDSSNTNQPLIIDKDVFYSAKALKESVFVVKFVYE